MATMPRNMVKAPSIQNNHLQAAWPKTPSMLDKTPAATRAEKAFEIRLPQKRMAFLRVSSRRVYHFDWIKRAPGRNAASTKPKQKRTATIPPKLLTLPLRVEIIPQMRMAPAMYQDGFEMRLIIMLEGTCMRIYPT